MDVLKASVNSRTGVSDLFGVPLWHAGKVFGVVAAVQKGRAFLTMIGTSFVLLPSNQLMDWAMLFCIRKCRRREASMPSSALRKRCKRFFSHQKPGLARLSGAGSELCGAID